MKIRTRESELEQANEKREHVSICSSRKSSFSTCSLDFWDKWEYYIYVYEEN